MAAIFGNYSQTSTWEPEPTTRGTFGILSSCLVTLGLCVWTAVHLNIPEHGRSAKQKYRKLGWMGFALIDPELVVYTSWRQRQNASRILQEACKAFGQELPTPWYRRLGSWLTSLVWHQQRSKPDVEKQSHPAKPTRLPWTMTHGHYVAMGGLAASFTLSSPAAGGTSSTSERLVITPSNFSAFLSRLGPDFLPNLSEDEIKDKSKANGLAKTIVCIQALWFGVQCFTRWSQRLSISLLELNVLGHTYSALAMYLLWWYKPLDVAESTVIDDEDFRELAAAWSLRTGAFRKEPLPRWLPPAQQCDASSDEAGSTSSPCSSFFANNDDHDIAGQDAFDDDDILTTAKWYSGFRFYGFSSGSGQQFGQRSWRDEKDGSNSPLSLGRPYVEISAQERLRWKLAARRYAREAKVASGASASSSLSSSPSPSCQSQDDSAYRSTVVRQVDDWFVSKYSIVERKDAAIGMILGGFVYGGIHALAWDAPFPSLKECILWRAASVVVIAFGPVYVSLWHVSHKGKSSISWIATTFYRLILAAYLFSRTYLVVECFIQLAHLPMSAYYAPKWSAYFPHFS